MYVSQPLCIIVFLTLFTSKVEGYSSGAPSGACTSMTPSHGAAAQSDASPYTVGLSASKYVLGGTLTVTLSGANFKGFLIKALPENDLSGSAIGTFSAATNNAGTALSQTACTGGATHTGGFSGASPTSTSLELTWNAPSADSGNVKFYVTFVKVAAEFWVQVPSATITLDNTIPATSSTNTTPATSSTNATSTPTTTTPAVTSTTPAATSTSTTAQEKQTDSSATAAVAQIFSVLAIAGVTMMLSW